MEKSRRYLKFIPFFKILFDSMNQRIVSTNDIAAKCLSRYIVPSKNSIRNRARYDFFFNKKCGNDKQRNNTNKKLKRYDLSKIVPAVVFNG